MSRISVGILNSGIGNVSSLYATLDAVGYKVVVTDDQKVLRGQDIIVLPGVGAFSAVMDVYEATGLAEFVKNAAGIGQPIIGICLGMQLLTQRSEESIGRKGLCLIPGETVRISDSRWHIGWNTLKTSSNNDFLKSEMGNYFYFNHGFRYQGDSKFCMSVAEYIEDIPAIVRYGNLVGLQFHPEKSQDAGRYLLRNCIADLMDAK